MSREKPKPGELKAKVAAGRSLAKAKPVATVVSDARQNDAGVCRKCRGLLPKKENPRSAAARDARGNRRGRLPLGTRLVFAWARPQVKEVGVFRDADPKGTPVWFGMIDVYDPEGVRVWGASASADGQFRLAEELDVKFWEWYTTAEKEARKRLVFAPEPPAPAPWPNPSGPAGTVSESP